MNNLINLIFTTEPSPRGTTPTKHGRCEGGSLVSYAPTHKNVRHCLVHPQLQLKLYPFSTCGLQIEKGFNFSCTWGWTTNRVASWCESCPWRIATQKSLATWSYSNENNFRRKYERKSKKKQVKWYYLKMSNLGTSENLRNGWKQWERRIERYWVICEMSMYSASISQKSPSA